MPIDTYNNSTILIVQLSDGGANGGATNLSGGAAAPTWSRHWLWMKSDVDQFLSASHFVVACEFFNAMADVNIVAK